MLKKTPSYSESAALDGVIATVILILGMMPSGSRVLLLKDFLLTSVGIVDALAAILFLLLWRYCFTLLKLYNKFATTQSRLLAIMQGIFLMMIPALLYYRIAHPNALRFRAVLLTVFALTIYEVARLALEVYLLDSLAAQDPRRAIIIGSGRRAGKAWRAIRTHYRHSIQLLGFVDDRDPGSMAPEMARRYLGGLDDLETILLKEVVDVVLIAMPIQSCYALMQRSVHLAENAGVKVVYLEDIYSTRKRVEDPTNLIFRELAPDQEQFLLRLAAKRLLDLTGAVFGLVFLSPLFVCLAIAVRMSSPGPVIFRQKRYGHHRRQFTMLKFRSMSADAEELLPQLEHANEAIGPIFKIRCDPRITKLGGILRRTSLDELPQLCNVLMGHMSLVGPRPMSVRDVSLFEEAALMRRFSVKPGMTGLWQIHGRSSVGFDEWIRMDNHYIDDWSLGLDVKILARTFEVLIKRSGAH